MVVREGVHHGGSLYSQQGNISSPTPKPLVGKVYGIVTTKNTPTEKQYNRVEGNIGTVFYKIYNSNKTVEGEITNDFLDQCEIALPKNANNQQYPLIGELIPIHKFPANTSQDTIIPTATAYYDSAININNNLQHNSQTTNPNASLGKTFSEKEDVRPLLSFEGDHIVQGRQGSALRFGSTTKLYNNLNEWSSIGKDDDPITILSNGFSYDPNEKFHVEKINKDLSSFYLTSAQKIPLQTDKTGVLNNLTNPLNAPDYFNAQAIINSDRVTLNSKKDEVMIFAKTNVEINTKNIINLNADERVHLNSPAIFLGPYDANNIPQPLLLGNNTYELLESLLDSLYNLGLSLSTVIGSPEGAPAVDINNAAGSLLNDLDRINGKLEGILSQQNFTV
jgi:hypothetical protein